MEFVLRKMFLNHSITILKIFDMTQEEKHTLLVDICARLLYGVQGITSDGIVSPLIVEGEADWDILTSLNYRIVKHGWKPFLRPISNMTEEEFGFLQEHLPYDFTRVYSGKFDLIDDIHIGNNISIDDMAFLLECFNKWHLDYRSLIPRGLALEAPEGMYNTKIE